MTGGQDAHPRRQSKDIKRFDMLNKDYSVRDAKPSSGQYSIT